MNICQSCGIELIEEVRGTNVDGSLSSDYCIFCYENGNFTEELTLEQAAINVAQNSNIPGVTPDEAYVFAKRHLAKLKRWKI